MDTRKDYTKAARTTALQTTVTRASVICVAIAVPAETNTPQPPPEGSVWLWDNNELLTWDDGKPIAL